MCIMPVAAVARGRMLMVGLEEMAAVEPVVQAIVLQMVMVVMAHQTVAVVAAAVSLVLMAR